MPLRLIDTVKCVVFDLDDTLYPERDYCKSGFNEVAGVFEQEFGIKSGDVFKFLWNLFNEGRREMIFNAALEEFRIDYDDKLVGRLVECYRNHKPAIFLPKESRNLLDKLAKAKVLALLTDGFMPAQKYKVQSLGIEGYFQQIVYTELLGRENWKPSTAGFELIMKSGFKANEYVYVADNPQKDFIAPNKLGWRSVFLNDIQNVRGGLQQGASGFETAEFEISFLPQLLEIKAD